jgi:predicted hydrocarbon binding protein
VNLLKKDMKCGNIEMRIWLETVQNVIGHNGLNAVLNHGNLNQYIDNFPPADYEMQIAAEEISDLFSSLYEVFGQKGSYSLLLRIGRERARIGIEKYNKGMMKALLVAARLVPETTKMRLSLERLVGEQNQVFPDSMDLHETDQFFVLTYRENFESEKITSESPVCGATLGSLQYGMEWITGHPHKVEEVECRAMGQPADVFRIWKKSCEKD